MEGPRLVSGALTAEVVETTDHSTSEAGRALAEIAATEVITLERIADDIRSEYTRRLRAEDRVVQAEKQAYEAQIQIGRLLVQARHMLPSDQAFGTWFRSQDFGFGDRWARTLRKAAEHEAEVREVVVGSQLPTGAKPNIEKALKQVCPPVPRALPSPDGSTQAKGRAILEDFGRAAGIPEGDLKALLDGEDPAQVAHRATERESGLHDPGRTVENKQFAYEYRVRWSWDHGQVVLDHVSSSVYKSAGGAKKKARELERSQGATAVVIERREVGPWEQV